jgi:riboflavin kinase/FMN adenylyltransferase
MVARCGIDQLFALRFDEKLALCPAETFIARDLVRGMQVRHLVVGDDFRFGANRRGDFAMLVREGKRWGFTVESIDSVLYNQRRVSSSQVREALARGRFDQAEALLGRPYSISGHVVHGRKLGRTLGFPTLNLRIDAELPALRGIFVVRVFGLPDDGVAPGVTGVIGVTAAPGVTGVTGAPGATGALGVTGAPGVPDMKVGKGVTGVASLGTRPAVEESGRFLLEVHLLGWSREVYGRIVCVEFLHKLRDEAHYPTLEALRAQIEIDRNAAIAYQQRSAVNP